MKKSLILCVFTAAALLLVVADDAQEEEAGAGFWSHVEKRQIRNPDEICDNMRCFALKLDDFFI